MCPFRSESIGEYFWILFGVPKKIQIGKLVLSWVGLQVGCWLVRLSIGIGSLFGEMEMKTSYWLIVLVVKAFCLPGMAVLYLLGYAVQLHWMGFHSGMLTANNEAKDAYLQKEAD